VFSFCLWPHEFEKSPLHQRIFLEELRSDVLQSFYMALTGFKKPVALLLRCAIEDALRHIFFYDHQVEFERMERTPSYYVNINELWSYIKKHPRLEELMDSTDSLNFLENYYAIFSRFVHSTTTAHMNLTKTLDQIQFDKEFFEQYSKQIINLAQNLHFILFYFYRKTLGHFDPPWKSFVLSMIPTNYREVIWK